MRYTLKDKFSRALVTGGAGFIGSHLVEDLLVDGLQVISLDDYSAGKSDNLKHLHEYSGFKEVNCDVTDLDNLAPHFEGVDLVFHQACSKMTVCLRDPRRDLRVNAEGTLNVLHAAHKAGVKKFVHASTGSVYGNPSYFPTDENHPVNPVSYYGVSKLAAEKYVRLFSDMYDMNTTILRYYHVYGPRQENSDVGGVCSIFGRRALQNQPLIIYGDGTQVRSFTYVKDLVEINRLVALRPESKGEAYNCASGVQVSVKTLADKVLAHFGKTNLGIEYRDWKIGDIKEFNVSNAKIKALGFQFQAEFDWGLGQTLDWLSKNVHRLAQ